MLNRQFLAVALVSGLVLITSGISIAAPEKQEPPACSLSVPSMSGLQMTAAPEGLDPALAAFLGAWEGKWETPSFPPLPSRFVVHRVDASTSTAFYAWGADGASMQPGSSSMNLQVDGKSLTSQGSVAKFTFTISEDGSTIEGVRETNQGLVSKVTMVRCTLAELASAAPSSQQAAAGSLVTVSPEMAEQRMLAYAKEVCLESQLLPEGQEVKRETHTNDQRIRYSLLYTNADGKAVTTIYTVGLDNKERWIGLLIREANIENARDFITADRIMDTLSKYLLPLPEAAAQSVWKQFRQPTGAPTIEKTWKNEDGTLESRGAALWGNNPAQGPGNYMVTAGRMWPGSSQYEKESIFAE
jgi:hypothetical protein